MKYDAIFFDLDGTVVDSLQDIVDAVNHTMRHFHLPEHTPQALKPHLGWGVGHLMRAILPDHTDAQVEEVLDHYRPYYARHAGDKTCPFPGVLPMMARLKADGLALGILSNKPDAAVQRLVAEFFPGLFNAVAGERDGVRRKPAPDTVNEVMSALGVTPDECVYVGDSEVDVETAANAKTACVCVSWGYRSAAALKAAGAKAIVDTTEQLADTLLN